jgi:hypothetical protein
MRACYCLIFLLTCCALYLPAQNDASRTANSKQLAAYFDSARYREVFMMGQRTEADSIWELDSSRQVLEGIVSDDAYSKRAAFFAAEILFDHSDWRPEGILKMRVAEIYAAALKENYTTIGNPWGLPDDTGDIGEHILDFGEVLVIEFKPLLRCETPVRYEGSKTATMGRDGKFRVKDIAASYIGAVRHIEFDASQDQKGRDKQIRKMRRKI